MSIKINCLISTGLMKAISVKPYHTMELINNVIGKMYTLIYQGSIVQQAFTVDGYKMKDGDCIFAVASNDEQQIKKWRGISSDTHCSIMERVNKKNALDYEKERIRISDIAMKKLELNNRKYRTFVKKYNRMVSKKESIPLKKPETKYTRPTSICNQELPKFW